MKIFWTLFLLIGYSSISESQILLKKFELNVKAIGIENGEVIRIVPLFEDPNNFQPECDSSLVKNGSFSFKGKVAGPTAFFLSWEKKGISGLLFIDTGIQNATVDFKEFINKSFEINGSKTNEESIYGFLPLRENIDSLNKQWTDKIEGLWDLYKGPELLEKISEQRSKREPIDNQYDSLLLKYSVTHPNSIISLALLVDDFRSYDPS